MLTAAELTAAPAVEVAATADELDDAEPEVDGVVIDALEGTVEVARVEAASVEVPETADDKAEEAEGVDDTATDDDDSSESPMVVLPTMTLG